MRNRLSVLVVIGLLAACGSGDDEPAAGDSETTAEATEESTESDGGTVDEDTADTDPGNTDADDSDASAGDDDSDANAGDDDGGDDGGNGISVSDLDDIPSECREIMGDFLREIEPIVSGIDWENATLADLERLDQDIALPSTNIDEDMAAAGCDDIDFGGDDDRGFDLSIELAKEEAPGVVGWLEFIQTVTEGFDPSGGETAGGPEDCDGAIAAVRELMSGTEKMTELPVEQLMSASTTLQSVTTLCSIDEMTALFDDPAFEDWAG